MSFCMIRGLFSILVFIPVLLIPGCGEAADGQSFELQSYEEEAAVDDALPVGVGEDFIYVYVCGRVNRPGVYSVSENCRVFECLQLAGGICADADISGINQAVKVSDGQQIYVPSVEEMQLAKKDGSSGLMTDGPLKAGNLGLTGSNAVSGSKDGLVNINTANASELTSITGIGNTRAQAILDYRDQNGRFEKIEDIMKVPGIKEGLFAKIKEQITI